MIDSISSHVQPSSGAEVGQVELAGAEVELAEGDGLVVAEVVVTTAAVTIQKHQDLDISKHAAVAEVDTRRSRISSLSVLFRCSSVTTITLGTRRSVILCLASLKNWTTPLLRTPIICGANMPLVSASESILSVGVRALPAGKSGLSQRHHTQSLSLILRH